MMRINTVPLLFLYSILLYSCDQGKKLPIPEPSNIIKVADGFSFTEGPTSDSAGNVYFTDQPNNRIYKYSLNGELSVFSDSSSRANGLYIDSDNRLWACGDEKNQLLRFSLNGKKEIVTIGLGEPTFNGPNDIWVHENGHVYFTDPIYQRAYWQHEHDTVGAQSFYLLDGKRLTLLDSTLVQANGIVGNSKKDLLYVADIGANKTYRYRIGDNGLVQEKTLFIEKGSDGMTTDANGNLYITGNGVDIYNADGDFLQHLDIPEDWTANVTFAGKNFDYLYITASNSLYKVKTTVSRVR